MSSWLLIIFMIGSLVTLGEFPRRFLKYSFIINICSWQAAFSFALEILSLLLIFFYYQPCYLWLSSTKFLILWIRPGIYSYCFFFTVCASSLWAFLSYCLLVFVEFLLLNMDAIFMLSHFFLLTSNSHRTLHLVLGLVGIHSATAFIWAEMKFSHSSFGVCVSDISRRVSNLFLTVTVYLLIISLLVTLWFCLFDSYFGIDLSISLLRWFCDQKILLQKRSMLHCSEHYLSTYCLCVFNLAVL